MSGARLPKRTRSLKSTTRWIQYPEGNGPCLVKWRDHLKVVDRKLDMELISNGREEV
jgi:hypothetical protein